MNARIVTITWILGFSIVMSGCLSVPEETEPTMLEEEEITLGPESLIDPSLDQKAVNLEGDSGGLMPGSFPEFPLLESSTVIDFGEDETSTYAISRVLLALDSTRQRYRQRAAAQGWNLVDSPNEALDEFRRGNETIRLTFTSSSLGTDVEFRW